MATSGVRCVMEPMRTAQQVSSSGDGAQLRCRAGALTLAGRGLATEGVMRCVQESRAALRHSFEEASVSGRAGADECRPVLDELFWTAGAEPAVDMAGEAHELQGWIYYGRRGGGDAYPGILATSSSTDEDVRKGGSELMVVALEAALQGAGRNAETLCQLAMRAWRMLGDAERAEQLFMEALQLAPQDSAIQASYAQFLWQCDA